MKECYPDRSSTARDILSYLSARPGEEDTLDNIVQGRFQGQASDRQQTLVKEVLADLVTQGRVRRVPGEGLMTRYQVQRGRK